MLPAELRTSSSTFLMAMDKVTRGITQELEPIDRVRMAVANCLAMKMTSHDILKVFFTHKTKASSAAAADPVVGARLYSPSFGPGTVVVSPTASVGDVVPSSPTRGPSRPEGGYEVKWESGLQAAYSKSQLLSWVCDDLNLAEDKTSVVLTLVDLNTGLRSLSTSLFNFAEDELREILDAIQAAQCASTQQPPVELSESGRSDAITREQWSKFVELVDADAPREDLRHHSSMHHPRSKLARQGSVKNYLDAAAAATAGDMAGQENYNAEEYVANMDPAVKKDWGIMYCGGSVPVLRELQAIRDQFGIQFAAESFDW